MTEEEFEDLLAVASKMGVTVVLHDEPAARYIVAPEQREVVLSRRLPAADRIRLLSRALRQFERDSDGPATRDLHPVRTAPDETVDDRRPTIMKIPSISRPIAEGLLDDLDTTMEELPPEMLARTVSASPSDDDPTLKMRWRGVATDTCTLYSAERYGEIAMLPLCNKHLRAMISGDLASDEVKLLRHIVPGHPEIGMARYDDAGNKRD